MQTILLEEAAEFLKMNAEVLRRKAKNGSVPGKKVGKSWVFVREHLADFISGRYPEPRRELQQLDGEAQTGEKQCQSTNVVKLGGFNSPRQTAKEYSDLLKLK